MNRLTVAAYKFAFKNIFYLVTNVHPEFEHGEHVKAFITDYSMAQHSGLASVVGLRACEMIRGCSVHYQRQALKVANTIAKKDRASKEVFLKIAYKIPHLVDEDQVHLAFDILCGASPLQDACEFIDLNEKELLADTKNWNLFTEWVNWWTNPKRMKMFSKAFRDMTDADWEICPRTTNAVESHNKLSNARTTLFLSALSTYYRVDKKSAYESIAAEEGISIGPTMEQRRKRNVKRKLYRIRAEQKTVEETEDENPNAFQLNSSQIV